MSLSEATLQMKLREDFLRSDIVPVGDMVVEVRMGGVGIAPASPCVDASTTATTISDTSIGSIAPIVGEFSVVVLQRVPPSIPTNLGVSLADTPTIILSPPYLPLSGTSTYRRHMLIMTRFEDVVVGSD